MSKDIVRYAVIGCGKHARRSHVVHGEKVGELELVGLFDTNSDQMDLVQAQVDRPLQRFASQEDLLACDDIDAVFIGTPDRFHAGSAWRAIHANKHVMCEKPLAVTPDGLQTMRYALQQAQERGLVFTSCHPRRYDPPYEYLSHVIPSMTAGWGKVLSFETDFSYHEPPADRPGLHAGLMQDHLNHEYDLMIWLFGIADTFAVKLFDSQDRYHVVGSRTDGLAFSFQGTRRLDVREFIETVRVRYEAGELHLNCHTGQVVFYDHEAGTVRPSGRPGSTDYDARFKRIMENFALSILGQEENYLHPAEIWANTDICVQLQEKGRSIRQLDDVPFRG